MLGVAVQARLLPVRIDLEPELRGNDHSPAERSEGLAHELFISEWAVHFSGVEKGDAAFDRGTDHRDHRLLLPGRTEAVAHAHAAESHRRDFEAAFPKFSFLHGGLLSLKCAHSNPDVRFCATSRQREQEIGRSAHPRGASASVTKRQIVRQN